MSARKPVLPNVAFLLTEGCGAIVDRGRAELRAAEAVIRAAKRVSRDWDHWDEATPETIRAFDRALARLDRVTGKGSK